MKTDEPFSISLPSSHSFPSNHSFPLHYVHSNDYSLLIAIWTCFDYLNKTGSLLIGAQADFCSPHPDPAYVHLLVHDQYWKGVNGLAWGMGTPYRGLISSPAEMTRKGMTRSNRWSEMPSFSKADGQTSLIPAMRKKTKDTILQYGLHQRERVINVTYRYGLRGGEFFLVSDIRIGGMIGEG